MPAPVVFVVAEPDVFRVLRGLEGLTVWADRFETCAAFTSAVERGEVPLSLRPAALVVSDSLPDGRAAYESLVREHPSLVVAVCWEAGPPDGLDVPCVGPHVSAGALEAAIWSRTGVARPEPVDDRVIDELFADDTPLFVEPPVYDVAAATVTVEDRSFGGRSLAVTSLGPSASASTTSMAFALASRLSLRAGMETVVVGLHDDGGLLGALVAATGPTLRELLDANGTAPPDADVVLSHQVRDSATGVRVLLPGGDLDLDAHPPEAVLAALAAVRARCDVMVLDLDAKASAATTGVAALHQADGVVLLAERGATSPSAVEGMPAGAPHVLVLTYDAEGRARPEAGVASGPDGHVALVPIVRRAGLGHADLRYVAGGTDVEQALDDVLGLLVPGLELPPVEAVEDEFWSGRRVDRRRRRRR